MEKCPEDLPDAESGDKKAVQKNRKAHQRQYHNCRRDHNGLVDTLINQGVKPVKGL